MAKTKIADLSHHQGTIDWNKAKDELALAIIRVQYGIGLIDRQYKNYVAGCKQYGIPFGHYDYCRFKTVAEAQKEAQYFIDRADPDACFFVADVEEVITSKQSDLVPATQAFVDYLHDHGIKKVGLYTGHSFYSTYGMNKVKADFLWIPRYSSNDTGLVPSGLRPSMYCDLWQFSQAGKLAGVTGHVDLNVINGNKPLSYFTSKTTTAPVVTAPPVTTAPVTHFVKPPVFSAKSDFFNTMKYYAVTAGKGTNMPWEVCLAQWAWESAYGKSSLCQRGNNFAGIVHTSHDDFKTGNFAGFYSIDNFVKEYIRVLNLSYYNAVRNAGSIADTCNALAKSPYSANDPSYGKNILNIINNNKLSSLSITPIATPKPPTPPVVATPKPVETKPAPKPKPAPTTPVVNPKPVETTPKPTTPVIVVPPKPKPAPIIVTITHTMEVKAGDTVASIAKAYDMTIAELNRLNNLTDTTKLAVGRVLKVTSKKEFVDDDSLPSNVYGGLTVRMDDVTIHDTPDLTSRAKMYANKGDTFNVFGVKNGLYLLAGDIYITSDPNQVDFFQNPYYRASS
ncbi:GH25 family lysozyme [Priestia megaterium]|uniref:GH25 family lysozyme n=1 Tax=Priestia megaterium TaxID=1404 RepID=UPI002FFF2654